MRRREKERQRRDRMEGRRGKGGRDKGTGEERETAWGEKSVKVGKRESRGVGTCRR